MESLTITHLKVVKRILRFLKDTLDYGLFYSSSREFKLKVIVIVIGSSEKNSGRFDFRVGSENRDWFS